MEELKDLKRGKRSGKKGIRNTEEEKKITNNNNNITSVFVTFRPFRVRGVFGELCGFQQRFQKVFDFD